MLHFAYGSNMCRAQIGARCPTAKPLGTATLQHWRFVIGVEGHGSIEPHPGAMVRGVLWRVGPRDLAAINAYENVGQGLYLRRILPVRYATDLVPALVYILRRRGRGKPRPGYVHLIVDAARAWGLPDTYVDSLRRWSPSAWRGARPRDTGEIR
jgi:AIG2-like family